MGVAGGELLIPTIVLLYGVISNSPAACPWPSPCPHARGVRQLQSRQAFTVLRGNAAFIVAMTAGSVTGTLLGALLLGIVPNLVLLPALALISATVKKYRIFCGKHVIPLLGACKLRDLTTRDVDAWLVELADVPAGRAGRKSKSLTPEHVDGVLMLTVTDRLHSTSSCLS